MGKHLIHVDKGSPFPSNQNKALLKACLYEGEEMLENWHFWRRNIDFESEIDGPAFRLLPLLYTNLAKHKVEDSLIGRLKGIYRQSWSNNHLLFLKAGKVLKLLAANNIETITLKGIPLTLMAYQNYGVRPMSDIDLLVKDHEIKNVLSILSESGFDMKSNYNLAYLRKYGNSISLSNSDGLEIDLHWKPVIESNRKGLKYEWWLDSIKIEVGGELTNSMNSENLLIHTIIHGLRYNPEPPIRWIPDAVYLMRSGINWKKFIDGVDKLQVNYLSYKGLSYLKENFDVKVPENVLSCLKLQKPRPFEKLSFKYAISKKNIPPKSSKEKLKSNFFFYLRQTHFTNPFFQVLGFFKYLIFSIRRKNAIVMLLHKLYSQIYLTKRVRLEGKKG